MNRNNDLVQHFAMQQPTLIQKLAWQATTLDEDRAWRSKFRQRLRRLVGRMPSQVPLQIEYTDEMETEAFIRRKIYIQSETHYWVPAYLFLPKPLPKSAPALVCLHGHSGIYPYIREGNEAELAKSKTLELDYAPYFAEQGYVTIAPIQRGWNETANSVDDKESGCQRMVTNSFLSGMTPIGLRCWDASRLLDFLQTQATVDPKRIGVAGLSGGGTVALFWTALERRLRLAIIAGYYCTFADSIYAIRHCICNVVPNMLEWGEMRDIAALIAPRPLLIINGKKDPIFPIAASRRAYAELEMVYDLLDAREMLEKDFFDGPHAWSNRKTLPFLKRNFEGALSR